MFNFTRAALSLEQAAKFAASGNEHMTATSLGKAERLILNTQFNFNQLRALVSLYDRVLVAAPNLEGAIPIRGNCEEMKSLLRQSME
jgi:hypothetical protein